MSDQTPLLVRPARPADRDPIVDFNLAMARETEGKDLSRERLTAGAAAVYADPAKGAYFVAERDGAVVGCLMITKEWSDWRNGDFWWIQRVYVPVKHRGTGVFRALYDDVLARARATEGVCGVRLYVERENAHAQRVYDAVGMRRSSYQFYEVDFVLG